MKEFILFLFVFILGYLWAISLIPMAGKVFLATDLKLFQREKWIHG